MSQNTGTLVTAAIRPNDSDDLIASAYANEVLGGHHGYATLAERNLIFTVRREWGMFCTVFNDGLNTGVYQLVYNLVDTDITNNANWELFAGGGSSTFVNANAVPNTVGGIASGTTFPTPQTVQQMFDALLYPYIAPGASLSGGNTREFGSSTAITLAWVATKRTLPITSITVAGNVIVPTGNTQSGNQSANATQNVNTTFTASVGDGTTTTNATTQVTWQNKRYWGTHSTLANPSDAEILALTGAGVGSGNELATSYAKTYNGINGGGDYLVFAWPTSFGITPTFTVNGLPNTAFTRIRAGLPFTNASGYTVNYDVWISNTPQFSPLTLFTIS